ncbi:hypothetical protein ACL9RL_10440 [Plantibacter sp. Mn2098]|uniref:hypothetical protein n=1 Tax=Plantibacter sp. Mn2098 TaxID=3395266 RepID=UPI003BCF82B0
MFDDRLDGRGGEPAAGLGLDDPVAEAGALERSACDAAEREASDDRGSTVGAAFQDEGSSAPAAIERCARASSPIHHSAVK